MRASSSSRLQPNSKGIERWTRESPSQCFDICLLEVVYLVIKGLAPTLNFSFITQPLEIMNSHFFLFVSRHNSNTIWIQWLKAPAEHLRSIWNPNRMRLANWKLSHFEILYFLLDGCSYWYSPNILRHSKMEWNGLKSLLSPLYPQAHQNWVAWIDGGFLDILLHFEVWN